MDKRLEKAIDSIDAQAHRFDALERSLETTALQVTAVSEKQDRLLSMLEAVLQAQVEIGEAIERLDERNVAEMELFLRLSKRVDCLEEIITPLPGSGNGSGSL
jgi:small-conductance mechanosensitive channel